MIDQIAARLLETGDINKTDERTPPLHVGDMLDLPGVQGKLTLRIVAVVHKPAILANVIPSIYVPLQTLQKFTMPDEPLPR